MSQLPSTNGTVNAVAVSGNTIYIGGSFTTVGGILRNNAAAIDANTGAVLGWNPNADGPVYALLVNGFTVFAGGSFSHMGGLPRIALAALDANSGVATGWNQPLPFTGLPVIYALASSTTPPVLFVGGDFVTSSGISRSMLAAFDPSSGTPLGWNPYADQPVYTLAVNGSTVYAGGALQTVNHGALIVGHLVALDNTGGTPVGALPHPDDVVRAVAVGGSTLYLGGDFTSVGAQARNRIAAIDVSSDTVTAWNPSANATVRALSLGASSVFAGGDFTSIGGQTRNRMAMLNATPNTNMATNWDPNADAPVRCLTAGVAVLYAGGDFTTVKTTSHVGFAGIFTCQADISGVVVAEGNSGTVNATFNVTLSPSAPFQVTVNYATQDGTATITDGDYQAASGQVVFSPGQTTQQVVVKVNGDTKPELNETFFVNLSNPVNTWMQTPQGTGTIVNDDNNFITVLAALPGLSDGAVAWGDYDNDGDLDILLAGSTTLTTNAPVTKVYRNDGNGVFTDIGASLTGVANSSVAWGDYDNDGDLDILLSGIDVNGAPVTKLYRNDGNGAFTNIGAGLIGAQAGAVAWGDYDNDGDLDILLSGVDANSAAVAKLYRNDGGVFTDVSASLPAAFSGSLAWGDYDNDGALDILLTGQPDLGGPISKVLRNGGGGSFADIGAALTGVRFSSAQWGDYDNDGDLDIALGGYPSSSTTLVYRNDGNGTFTDTFAFLPPPVSGVAWGDADHDGDLDLLIVALEGMRVYRNDWPTPNVTPSAPGNLSAVRNGGLVTFSWSPASDDHTPASGLSYNLRVGTTPAGDQVMSAMAAANGYRRLAQLGNVQERTSWTLALPPGSYYWSVQAIDGAFQGSPFAGSTVAVEDTPEAPLTLGLGPATPNPFTTQAALSVSLPRQTHLEVSVFDLFGRRLRFLENGVRPAGTHRVQWDGRDEAGVRQKDGVYLVRMTTAGKTWARKLVLAR